MIKIYTYQYGSHIIYCQISILGTEQEQKFLTAVFQRPAGCVHIEDYHHQINLSFSNPVMHNKNVRRSVMIRYVLKIC